MKETETLPFFSIAAPRPGGRFCQTDVLPMLVFRFADWAGVYDTAVICVFIHKMHSAACRAVVASGAEWLPVGIKINAADGNGQGVVFVFLLSAFEFRYFGLHGFDSRNKPGDFPFLLGDTPRQPAVFEFKVGIPLRQVDESAGFGNQEIKEARHV